VKVIFLDFDGVLNSDAYFEKLGPLPRKQEHAPPPGVPEDFAQIDAEAVARLSVIVARTGAVVVLSTTWRYLFDLDVIESALAAFGFVGEIIGRTPTDPIQRGEQIAAWIRHQPSPPESYVVLDDDDVDILGEVRDRLIKTDFKDGLQDRHVETAVALLGVTGD